MSDVLKFILTFASGVLIPGVLLLIKVVRGQTELRSDVKDIRAYVILLCQKANIDCILTAKKEV